jgi:hypothetical protein
MKEVVMIDQLVPINTTVFVSDFPEPVQRIICRRYRLMSPHLANMAESEIRRLLDDIDLASAFGIGNR